MVIRARTRYVRPPFCKSRVCIGTCVKLLRVQARITFRPCRPNYLRYMDTDVIPGGNGIWPAQSRFRVSDNNFTKCQKCQLQQRCCSLVELFSFIRYVIVPYLFLILMTLNFDVIDDAEMISEQPEGVRSSITTTINTLTGNPKLERIKLSAVVRLAG